MVRGETDDGDIEFVFCGIIAPAVSKLFGMDFGECISLARCAVFEPGDIRIGKKPFQNNTISVKHTQSIAFVLFKVLKLIKLSVQT